MLRKKNTPSYLAPPFCSWDVVSHAEYSWNLGCLHSCKQMLRKKNTPSYLAPPFCSWDVVSHAEYSWNLGCLHSCKQMLRKKNTPSYLAPPYCSWDVVSQEEYSWNPGCRHSCSQMLGHLLIITLGRLIPGMVRWHLSGLSSGHRLISKSCCCCCCRGYDLVTCHLLILNFLRIA